MKRTLLNNLDFVLHFLTGTLLSVVAYVFLNIIDATFPLYVKLLFPLAFTFSFAVYNELFDGKLSLSDIAYTLIGVLPSYGLVLSEYVKFEFADAAAIVSGAFLLSLFATKKFWGDAFDDYKEGFRYVIFISVGVIWMVLLFWLSQYV